MKNRKKFILIGTGVLALIVLIGALFVVRPRGGEVPKSLKYNAYYSFLEFVKKTSSSPDPNKKEEKQTYDPAKDVGPSKKIRKKLNVEENIYEGLKYYTLSPKNGGNSNSKSIFYLHGGGYVQEISGFQWQLINKLINKTGSTVIVPIYPLAKAQPYYDTFPMLLKLYEKTLTNTSADNLVFMGDSAGGGMALALAELLDKEKLAQPRDIVLLSPWLDASLSNSAIKDIEKLDPVLSRSSLLNAAKIYAGGDDLNNYLVSPINGNIKNLGKITLFVGTHEIFLPDARKLKTMADDMGIAINYAEYPEMFHAWVIFPMHESDKTIDDIVKLIF